MSKSWFVVPLLVLLFVGVYVAFGTVGSLLRISSVGTVVSAKSPAGVFSLTALVVLAVTVALFLFKRRQHKH